MVEGWAKMPFNLMQRVTKSLGTQWGRLEGEEVERGGEGRLAAWKEEEERKLRPVDRQHLEEEARRVTRKLKSVGRRLEEEQVVKQEMKARERADKVLKERLEEERKVEESDRAARNREWRMKRETEECLREGQMVGSLEEVLVSELVCTSCQAALWKGAIYQCIDGHLACSSCNPADCTICQTPLQGRNRALERLRMTLTQ